MSGTVTIRAAVFGTGRIGREVIRGCAADPGIDVVAAVVTDAAKAGRDIGELAGLPPLGIGASLDLDAVLGRPDVDLVFYCGLGDPAAVADRGDLVEVELSGYPGTRNKVLF